MAGYIGKLDAFDGSTDNGMMYIERIEQYFEANDIADAKKVSVLISAMGGNTYSLLRNLTAPDKPAELSFRKIVETMQNHLCPKPLLIVEHFRFHKRNQNEGESVSAYVAELKKLSEYCEFGDGLSDALRDRLVCGLLKESIQKRLLTEDKLTFKSAVEIAVSMEAAARDATELQSGAKVSVHKLYSKRSAAGPSERCYRCGGGSHIAAKCRFKTEKCRKCNKVGHIQRACLSVKNKNHSNNRDTVKKTRQNFTKHSEVRAVDQHLNSDDDIGLGSLDIYQVKVDRKQPIWLTPEVNGKMVKMELDTGSAVSVISQSEYEQYFKGTALKPSDIHLKTYTGERIRPVGVVPVNVKYQNQHSMLNLYVVKSHGPTLFGRDWLTQIQLDWRSIYSICTIPSTEVSTETELKRVLQSAADVFQDGIGTLKHIKGKIVLNENVSPKFHKARPVPYSIREKVAKGCYCCSTYAEVDIVSRRIQIENLPVTAEMIRNHTRRDPTLSQVYVATLNGWTAQQKSQFGETAATSCKSLQRSSSPGSLVGQTVLARDYRGNQKWIAGTIAACTGPLSYNVEVAPGVLWRRHIDQLRRTQMPISKKSSEVFMAPPPAPELSTPEESHTPATEIPASASSPKQTDRVGNERCYPVRDRKPPESLDL
ncbi:hypothetical protein MHYP_G00309250 [Metynnis hypsauchen]